MISKEEVKHIAKLARLELTEKEIEKMQKDMSTVLDYFNVLKSAPKIKVASSLSNQVLSLRKDEAVPGHETSAGLVEAAPDKKDGYIKVKTVL